MGQMILILCFIVYLIWWYRGFRPGVNVSRVGGVNGILLVVMIASGIFGVMFSLSSTESTPPKINPMVIFIAGVLVYIVLLMVTLFAFNRTVTTELILIVGWTVLEVFVINRLNAAGTLSDRGFFTMCIVIAAAFIISIILYVAYYKMEDMMAFYSAMIPLAAGAISMIILVGICMMKG